METKYNLRISKMYDVNDLSTAVITSLSVTEVFCLLFFSGVKKQKQR